MNSAQIKKLAEALGLPAKGPDTRGYVHLPCPFAKWKHSGGKDSNPSFGVKVHEAGHSKAYCFSCKSGGFTRDWITELQMLGYPADSWPALLQVLDDEDEGIEFPSFDEEHFPDQKHPFHLFPEEWLASFLPAHKSPTAVQYLQARGVTLLDIEECDLRWDGHRRRVCFPIRDPKGHLVGMQGRKVDDADEGPKYLHYRHEEKANPYHMLGEHLTDPDLPVVLVEGPLDYIAVRRAYRNVLSLNGTTLTKERLERLEDYFELIVMLDDDDAGKSAVTYLKKWAWKQKIVQVAELPEGQDPASTLSEDLREILEEFVPVQQIICN